MPLLLKIENLPGSACPMGYIYKYIHMTCSLNYARLSDTGVSFLSMLCKESCYFTVVAFMRKEQKKKSMVIKNKIKGKEKKKTS